MMRGFHVLSERRTSWSLDGLSSPGLLEDTLYPLCAAEPWRR
ncbi:hypothetical protein [Streptomyces griseicoloratus]|nr:hypothetical protein [Streptomyces griseicoloratus]